MNVFDYNSYFFIILSFLIKLFSVLYNNSLFIEELIRNAVMREIITNIEKLVDENLLLYNFARQADITNGLLEGSIALI
jgi:F0F1-type ATP synthase gamma subunit